MSDFDIQYLIQFSKDEKLEILKNLDNVIGNFINEYDRILKLRCQYKDKLNVIDTTSIIFSIITGNIFKCEKLLRNLCNKINNTRFPDYNKIVLDEAFVYNSFQSIIIYEDKQPIYFGFDNDLRKGDDLLGYIKMNCFEFDYTYKELLNEILQYLKILFKYNKEAIEIINKQTKHYLFKHMKNLSLLNYEFLGKEMLKDAFCPKVNLYNIRFTFSSDKILDEKLDILVPNEFIKIQNKKDVVKKSNRGKKSNKIKHKKIEKFGSSIAFLVYDEIYKREFNIKIFRKNSGNISGLPYIDNYLIKRLINNIIEFINLQYPDKNIQYRSHHVNLCNITNKLIIPGNTINPYKLRDFVYLIYNKADIFYDFIIKKKEINAIDFNDTNIRLKNNFIGCNKLESKVYLNIKYRIDDNTITIKINTDGKMYTLGSKSILLCKNIIYEILYIIYKYNKYILC